MSSEDIDSGAGWNQQIRNALNASNFGIVFVTRENLGSEWLMFDAGALAKHVDESRVVPLIVDEALKPETLRGPLGQLQAREVEKEKMRRLIRDLNYTSESKMPDDRLNRCFEVNWPRLEERLQALPEPTGEIPTDGQDEMIKQMFALLKADRSARNRSENRPPTHGFGGLHRLQLRLKDLGATAELEEKAVEYWKTLGEDEVFIAVEHGGDTLNVYKNGDVEVVDWSPF